MDTVPSAAAEQAIDDLVTANHILFHQRVVDAFGHVSQRHPDDPGRYMLARSMPPAKVQHADIQIYHLDSTPVAADAPQGYLERFIHGEIYRARPDVMAVVHSHSPSVIPFGIVRNVKLRAVFHVAGFLRMATPVFEIRDQGGPGTDMLVSNPGLGQALASCLCDAAVVLMRGHGSTAVGNSLRQAVFRAVYTEVNARLQAEALGLGDVTYLTDEEAIAAAAANDGQLGRAWSLWAEEVGAQHRAAPPSP